MGENCLGRERADLSAYAVSSADSRGRARPETPCTVRTEFQRDVDRIVHSKSFRRLMHKTQVFLNPEGDHYRTRMTHTVEVSRIARTLARALGLNEDLTEAISLGHDLGHTPFGHAGEAALDMALQTLGTDLRFSHNAQSLRVVETLENNGRGLNLTWEVRDGIRHHSGSQPAATLEGQLVHISDRIAYVNHDIDDALRAGIIAAVPKEFDRALGCGHSKRIDTLVRDVIDHSRGKPEVGMSPAVGETFLALRAFLFDNVYRSTVAKGEEGRAKTMLIQMFNHYMARPEELPADYQALRQRDGLPRVVCDYLAGMTDRFAVSAFARLTIPRGWVKR